MNRHIYENTHYDEALDYVQKYTKTKEDGYYSSTELTGKSDQIQVQQNNTIIALLTSLHFRITKLEGKLFDLEQKLSKVPIEDNWKSALENINIGLGKLSTGKIIRNRPTTYTFLTYKPEESK